MRASWHLPARRRALAAGALLGALALGPASGAPAEQVFVLQVSAERAGARAPTFRATQDADVVIRLQSDRPVAVHLHGYDIEKATGADTPVDLRVKARLPGRFPITEHAHGATHHHRAIAYLEVHPGR